MRLLLDTHSFLWFIAGDFRFSVDAKLLIEDAGNTKLLSVASLWEAAIKVSIGKLTLNDPFEPLMRQHLTRNGIRLLGITVAHAAAVAQLPLHHRDPFDRLIIAQALVEQLSVVSRDPAFDAYGVTRIW